MGGELLSLLQEASTRLINITPDAFPKVSVELLERLGRAVGSDNVIAYRAVWEGEQLVGFERTAEYRAKPGPAYGDFHPRDALDDWFCDRLTTGEPIEVRRSGTEPELVKIRRLLELEDIDTQLAVGICIDGRLAAGLSVDWVHESGSWTDEQISAIRLVGELVVSTRVRLRSAVKEHELRLAHEKAQVHAQHYAAQLEAIIERVQDAFFGLNEDFVTVMVNTATERLTGLHRDHLIGKNPFEVVEGIPRHPVEKAIRAAMREETPRSVELNVPPLGGWLDIHIHPSKTGISAVFQRIDARKAREATERRERELLREQTMGPPLIGASAGLASTMRLVERVARANTPVLILGESGVGKELIAREVYLHSQRAGKPFVKLNCAAVSEAVADSELFGHEKGSFTGALERRLGRFEVADGGTLFLDEVGELALPLQAKLLRALQEGEISRVGSSETFQVDVRVIAATNRDLKKAIAQGTFREDLYYRLQVVPIHVPPLRERTQDIEHLVKGLLTDHEQALGRRFAPLASDDLQRLQCYRWPGNVRELCNVVARAAILSPGDRLEIPELEPPGESASPRSGTNDRGSSLLEDVERGHIRRVLEEVDWTVGGPRGAAVRLGLHPSTLRSRMQKLGIPTTRPS